MKKYMIGVLFVAVAIVTHAASVKWSMSNGVLSPSPDGSATTGRLSYYTMLVFTDSQAAAVDSAIAAGNFASLSSLAQSSYVASKSGVFSGSVSGLTGTSATLFAVVFDTYSATEGISDAGYYYKTGTVTQNTYDPSGIDSATEAKFTTAQMTGTWTSTSAAPEPTCGVMLLLGMASLALKRKRA